MWYRSLYYLKKAFDTLSYSSEELSQFQDRQVQNVTSVCKSISYYDDYWPDHTSVDSKEDLQKLPIMESSSFRDQQRNMDQVTRGTELSRQTSGTTGNPTRVRFSEQAHDWLSAVYIRTLLIHGYRPRQSISQYWREPEDNRTWFGKTLMPIKYIRSGKHLNEQIDILVENDPDVLKYFPHVLLALCKKINREQKEVDIDPDFIITYGELLTPSIREYIENTFDASVVDHYATTEFGVVAWECPDGGYHVAEDSVYAESVDSKGVEVSNGETGKMVITGLVNSDTPLVRYEIGDLVEFTGKSCSCKTSFKRIKRIRGREKDVFFNAEREPIFPDQVVDIIAPVEEILFFQLIAEDKKYRIKYVPNTGFEESMMEELVSELESKLSLEPIELVEVEEIPRSEGGKVRIIENNQSQSHDSSKIF